MATPAPRTAATRPAESRGWFRSKAPYDRREILAAAAAAQGKGKSKKALAEYRKVLDVEPDNPTLLMKTAVLFAETRQPDDAWRSFIKAAELFRKDGLVDKCSSVWSQAVIYFPRSEEAWLSLARAKTARGVPADAAASLLTGSRNFKRRKDRETRVELLREAFALGPYVYDVTMEYSTALSAAGLRSDAIELLEELVVRLSGSRRRTVRRRLFRLRPTPAAAWRWLRGS